VTLPGRKREGWTLHILLDTSGSMSSEFSRALGAIASFCEGANVSEVHILQCDQDVTRDEFLAPEELSMFTIAGFGGSDVSPGLRRLAEDPEVEVAMVITDGYIEYPVEPLPYHVLWALTDEHETFSPPYGQILRTI
jgi:predicted metal-dependent peptidase